MLKRSCNVVMAYCDVSGLVALLLTKGRFLVILVNYNHQFTFIRCLVTTAAIGQR